MKYTQQQLKTIHVEQLGQYACGLACISAITRYYGGDVSQEKIREISGTTLQGTSLLGLYQASKKIGFEAKGFEADIENLKGLDHPVILHVIMDEKREHFIVCYGYEDGMFTIGDPGWGITTFSEDELSAIWQSKALLSIKPSSEFATKEENKKGQWAWLKSLLQEDVPILSVAAAMGVVMAVLGLSTAIFSQKLIDDFLPNQETQKIFIGFAALLLLLSARSVLGLIRGIFMAQQGKTLNIRIINAFIEKVLRLSIAYVRGYSTGDLIARMNDSLRIRNTVALITGNILISILVVLISSGYLLYLSMPIGCLSLTSIVIFLLIAWKYHPVIREKQKEVMAAHSANETQYIDALTGINTVKSYGKEEAFNQRINMVYDFYQTKGYELALIGNKFGFITQLTVGIYITGIFALGVWYVLNGSIMLGELMAIVTVGGSMIPSLAGLMTANIQIQEAKIAFNRMYELTAVDTEFVEGASSAVSTNSSEKALKVENLTFRFPGASPLLNELSLTVPSGKVVTLFGEIGSGKSTLVDIIQLYHSIEDGELLVNGINKKDTSIKEWRSEIGVVAQKEKIFNSTVIDNICMSNDQNEMQECIEFLEAGIFGEYLKQLPQGYLTLCGEEGNNLSGGQKQIVGIARALYKYPSYLILDESTSAMDQSTEREVLEYLKKVGEEEDMGILLITHRLSLARQSDLIYLLAQGSIEGSGPHDELIQKENLYSNAYYQLIGTKPSERLLN